MVEFYGNIVSEYARDPEKYEELRMELSEKFNKKLPSIMRNLSETSPCISKDDEEFTSLLKEAIEAYSQSHWRAVIALIGVAGESFTNQMYEQISDFTSIKGVKMGRMDLLGKDEHVNERIKIAALRFCNEIDDSVYTQLLKIKDFRDHCVHPQRKKHQWHNEAKESLNSFIRITNWNSQKMYNNSKHKNIEIMALQ